MKSSPSTSNTSSNTSKKQQTEVQALASSSAVKPPKLPPWRHLVEEAVASTDDRKGITRHGLNTYFKENYQIDVTQGMNKFHLKRALQARLLSEINLKGGPHRLTIDICLCRMQTSVEKGRLLQENSARWRMSAATKKKVRSESPEAKPKKLVPKKAAPEKKDKGKKTTVTEKKHAIISVTKKPVKSKAKK
ncbi:hypothetical protein T439DRAFT_355620 [Meredithblackwellia eburnea MCA 4105]